MHFLSWNEAYFASVVLAGLIAGYVMFLAGVWSARFPGLVAIDIADFGRRYMVSDRPSAWLLGLASHHVNSILLTLVWACVIVPNVPWPRPLTGMLWGVVLAFTLAGSLVVPLSGLGFHGRKVGDWRFPVTNLVLHIIWGLLIGVVYTPL